MQSMQAALMDSAAYVRYLRSILLEFQFAEAAQQGEHPFKWKYLQHVTLSTEITAGARLLDRAITGLLILQAPAHQVSSRSLQHSAC